LSAVLKATRSPASLGAFPAFWISLATSAFAQGSFQNLDFESPNVASLTNLFVAFGDAFPGWTGWYRDTNVTSLAGYNFVSGGSALVTLITPTAPVYGGSIIEGNYTATIAAGLASPNGTLSSAAISQIGAIPASAQSIRFSAANTEFLAVTFNGTNVPFSAVGTGPDYTIYAGDVRPFAGLTGELRFTEQAAITEPVVILDDISFSPAAIPEPGVLCLSALAALLLASRLRRCKPRKASGRQYRSRSQKTNTVA